MPNSSLIAMVNPAGGAVVLLFVALVLVGPISLVIHHSTGRFLRTWLGVSVAATLALLVLACVADGGWRASSLRLVGIFGQKRQTRRNLRLRLGERVEQTARCLR